MASMSETSYWINFFTSSGIPAGDATHYAIIFSDNRITREMLLDLSKEYLTDMGISRLGDVIAILKHAKTVFNQEARDKVMKSTAFPNESLQPTSNSSSRRSTAASRMVNHFTSKHPEAAPMSQSPVPKLPPPDPPKSKRKVSVFERLGADDLQATVSLPSGKNTAAQNSVFSRLGGKAAVKRAASSTSLEDLDHLIESTSSLPYAGVLKNSPSPAKKANIKVAVSRQQAKMKKIVKTVKVEDDKAASNIQRPEVSTTTEGVLSDFAKRDSLSLKDRLGRKTDSETPNSTSGAKSERPKFMTTAKQRTERASNLQKRLGSRKEDSQSSPVVSSTQQKPKLKTKQGGMSSDALSNSSGGVFSRLGKKTS